MVPSKPSSNEEKPAEPSSTEEKPVDGSLGAPDPTGPAQAPASSSAGLAGKVSEEVGSLTQRFTNMDHDQIVSTDVVKQPSDKERYLACTLAVPGICLKKMAILAENGPETTRVSVAVLGVSSTKQYRKEKFCLKGMVLGDAINKKSHFWMSAAKHIHPEAVGAICVFDNFAGSIEQVS